MKPLVSLSEISSVDSIFLYKLSARGHDMLLFYYLPVVMKVENRILAHIHPYIRVLAQETEILLRFWFPNFKAPYLENNFSPDFSFVFFDLLLQFSFDFFHSDINEKKKLSSTECRD